MMLETNPLNCINSCAEYRDAVGAKEISVKIYSEQESLSAENIFRNFFVNGIKKIDETITDLKSKHPKLFMEI